jgi:hypothetical protein
VQLASAVAVPTIKRAVPSRLFPVQSARGVQASQLPALVSHEPVSHAAQTLSVVDVGPVIVVRALPPAWLPQTVTAVQTVGVPVL